MARFLLDTNIVSFLMKRFPAVTRRFQSVTPEALVLSTVVEAELRYGAQRLPREANIHVVLREFLRRITILPWDSACAERYGELRAFLESKGKGMEVSDTMIAAHALAHDLTLVTNDKAFARVPGLRLEDWTKETKSG
jgi:tRNA(fMet)-specific endonuclease VapC